MTANGPWQIEHAVVMGAGAIGSYYGALLSKKIDVLLVGRRSHVDAINERGLKISGIIRGTFHVRASEEPRNIPRNTLMLLTTKAQDSEGAVKSIRNLISSSVKILVLQNGLGNEELVRILVGPDVEVIRGLCSSGVEFMSPGVIQVKHVGETVLPRTRTGERIKRLLDSCGLETRLSDQMDVEIWRKLTMNCVINPLTAIFRIPDREIAVDSLKEVKGKIVSECIKVAEREGVALNPILAEEVDSAAASYTNLSSMCQDILKGRKTEIDFLNGKVSELGRKHGIETPVNDIMVALIRFMEGRKWT